MAIGLKFYNDDYAIVPRSSSLEGMSSLTICFRVYLTSLPSTEGRSFGIMDKADTASDNTSDYEVYIDSNDKIRFRISESWHHDILTSNTALTIETWYDVVCTFNTGDTLKIYINSSSEDASMTTSYGPINSGSPIDLTIGADENQNSNANTYLKDMRIYSREFSDAEAGDYHNNNSISTTNLQAHWKCDTDTGNTLEDSTSNNNNGTIYGATWEFNTAPDAPTNPTPANGATGVTLN